MAAVAAPPPSLPGPSETPYSRAAPRAPSVTSSRPPSRASKRDSDASVSQVKVEEAKEAVKKEDSPAAPVAARPAPPALIIDRGSSAGPAPDKPRSASPERRREASREAPAGAGKDAGVPARPPPRPIAGSRSKFDLEPNPFEQSFSARSHRSASEQEEGEGGKTPPRGGDATATKPNALPPLSSLTSPAAADPSQFPWLANQSLRAGPLSPAMLAGPQNHGSSSRNGSGEDGQAGGAFDSSTFRTGFTPGTGSGFTPSYGSLLGGSGGFSNLPMPSPNTAAFLNMVTNATPIEADTSGQAQEGQQGAGGSGSGSGSGNGSSSQGHGPSAIPPHMQQHHGLAHINSSDHVPQETITPNTLSALTGVFNDMHRQGSQGQHQQHQQHHPGMPQHGNSHAGNSHAGQPGYYPQPPMPHHPHSHAQGQHLPPAPPPPGPSGVPGHPDYAQQSANAASQAANGLFLLSQAHQELSKREEEVRGPMQPGQGQGQGQGQGSMQMQHAMQAQQAHQQAQAHAQAAAQAQHHAQQHMQAQQAHAQAQAHMHQQQHHQQAQMQQQQMHMQGQGAAPGQAQAPGQGKRHSSSSNSNPPGMKANGAGSVSGPGIAPGQIAGAGAKRKSDASAAGGKGSKKKKGAAKDKAESASPARMGGGASGGFGGMAGMGGMGDDSDGDDDEDDEGSQSGMGRNGKPETEEDKRKNFLERNRQAALKCRQRKKAWLNELQAKVEQVQMENDRLNQTVAGLHDEVSRLTGILMQHRDCGLAMGLGGPGPVGPAGPGYGRPMGR